MAANKEPGSIGNQNNEDPGARTSNLEMELARLEQEEESLLQAQQLMFAARPRSPETIEELEEKLRRLNAEYAVLNAERRAARVAYNAMAQPAFPSVVMAPVAPMASRAAFPSVVMAPVDPRAAPMASRAAPMVSRAAPMASRAAPMASRAAFPSVVMAPAAPRVAPKAPKQGGTRRKRSKRSKRSRRH